MTTIAVIGAGAFGTALAISLAEDGADVDLIARSQDHVDQMNADRLNAKRLAGAVFPKGLNAALSLNKSYDVALVAVPTQVLGGHIALHRASLVSTPLVACNKGIDMSSGLGPTGILTKAMPGAQVAALSGPGFASDIAAHLPTALTLAADDPALAENLQRALSTQTLRIYRSGDVAGVELGGALKNVVAIAAGVVIGAGLGESARAAVMTRGYAELTRFAVARGARPETLAGLSGLGDLVLTCTSEKSRNFRFGVALGQGTRLDASVTVEGAATARIVSKQAKNAKVSTPITDLVTAIIDEKVTVAQAQGILLARPLKEE